MELTISIIALGISLFTFIRSLIEYRIRVKATVSIDYEELTFHVYNNSKRPITINHIKFFAASSRYKFISNDRYYFHTYFDENWYGYKDIEPFRYATFTFSEEDSIFHTYHKKPKRKFLEVIISGGIKRVVKVS